MFRKMYSLSYTILDRMYKTCSKNVCNICCKNLHLKLSPPFIFTVAYQFSLYFIELGIVILKTFVILLSSKEYFPVSISEQRKKCPHKKKKPVCYWCGSSFRLDLQNPHNLMIYSEQLNKDVILSRMVYREKWLHFKCIVYKSIWMPLIIFLVRMKFHILDLLDIFLVLIFFNLVLVTLYQHLCC